MAPHFEAEVPVVEALPKAGANGWVGRRMSGSGFSRSLIPEGSVLNLRVPVLEAVLGKTRRTEF
jgi:hypothetical protein